MQIYNQKNVFEFLKNWEPLRVKTVMKIFKFKESKG